jgi:ankyrin repeat protein
MLAHAVPSVWRGEGLTVAGVTLPSHIVAVHIDPHARAWQLALTFGSAERALNQAARAGAHWDVTRLLRASVGAEAGDRAGPLGWAAGHGHLDIVELLLRAGAKAGAHDNVALLWASGRGHLAVVERLLQEPDIDAAARGGWAVRWAEQRGHVRVVAYLKNFLNQS